MNIMQIATTADAMCFVENSGVTDWEWGGQASAEGFADWLYRNRDAADRDDYEAELVAYLISVGENPADYGL